MADPVMLGGLGQALIDVVDPLRRALSSPDAFEALMRRQGWKPPPTREYFAVVSDAFKLVGAVETAIASIQSLLDGDSSDPGALLAGIDALAKVIADLRAIGRPAGTLPPPFDTDEFWTTFPTDLIAALFMRYMEVAQPTWFAPLHLLGVLDEEAVDPAGAPGRLPFTRSKVEWGRLVTLFSDPTSLARDVYGWGGRSSTARCSAGSSACCSPSAYRPAATAASVAGRPIPWGRVPAGRRARTARAAGRGAAPRFGLRACRLARPPDTAIRHADGRADRLLHRTLCLRAGGRARRPRRPARARAQGRSRKRRQCRHSKCGRSPSARISERPGPIWISKRRSPSNRRRLLLLLGSEQFAPDPDRQEPARAVVDRPGRVGRTAAHVRVRFPVGDLRSVRRRQLRHRAVRQRPEERRGRAAG